MRTSTVAKQPPIYLTIGNYYHEFYTKSFTTSQSIYFQNQNYFPISDGCSRRMFLGQTEYKERRLLRNLLKIKTSQKLKTVFPLATNNASLLAIGNYGREADAFSNNLAENNRKAAASLKTTNNGSFGQLGTTAAKRTPSWIGQKNKWVTMRQLGFTSKYCRKVAAFLNWWHQ